MTPETDREPAQGLVYVFGRLGYDFGTDARYDSFVQYSRGEDQGQKWDFRKAEDFANHLSFADGHNLHKAERVIWTLEHDETPIYAVEPRGPFAASTYERLVSYLKQQTDEGDEENQESIERVSLPGYATGASITLSSGMSVPIVVPEQHGLSGWHINKRVGQMVDAMDIEDAARPEEIQKVKNLLERVYHELRNPGLSPGDRALNYAATNAFQIAGIFGQARAESQVLDGIDVEQSPMCRPHSDCWVVKLKFFNPKARADEARRVYQITIDVSDVVPVTVGKVRSWFVY